MLASSQPIDDRSEPIGDLIRDGKHRDAIAACATQFGPSVGRLCMAMLGDQSEADEVAQESFLAAYRGMATYRGDGSIRSWIYGIARRQCARRLERGPRQHLELVDEAHASSDDPEAEVRSTRRSSDLQNLLTTLKPSERDTLVLRFAADLSFKEVGAILKIDEATARKRASRGLLRLRTTLRPEDVE